jgi:hypothetical protein
VSFVCVQGPRPISSPRRLFLRPPPGRYLLPPVYLCTCGAHDDGGGQVSGCTASRLRTCFNPAPPPSSPKPSFARISARRPWRQAADTSDRTEKHLTMPIPMRSGGIGGLVRVQRGVAQAAGGRRCGNLQGSRHSRVPEPRACTLPCTGVPLSLAPSSSHIGVAPPDSNLSRQCRAPPAAATPPWSSIAFDYLR